MPEPRKTVAVDLDGVLADFSRGFVDIHTIGDPIPGAVEFTRRLSRFADVLIWTTRCNPEIGRGMGTNLLRNMVRDWLDRHGFVYADIWTGPVKPIASAFIDDRAVSCRPQGPRTLPDGFDAYMMAEACARQLCKDTPPGCSLSHTRPVLEATGNYPESPDGSRRATRIITRPLDVIHDLRLDLEASLRSHQETIAELAVYHDALLRIACLPDSSGKTYGSRLHDVGACQQEAEQALRAVLGDAKVDRMWADREAAFVDALNADETEELTR